MKKIILGLVIGFGLFIGFSVIADYNPFTYIGTSGGYLSIDKYYDKDSNVVCYKIFTGNGVAISCLKNI